MRRFLLATTAVLASSVALGQTRPTIPHSSYTANGAVIGEKDLLDTFQLYADSLRLDAEANRAKAAEALAALRIARHRSVDDYSPAGNCSTDDTTVFITAMAAVLADGGGELEVGPHCYAVGALSIPARVKLVGRWHPGSQSYLNYSTTPYTLAVDPAKGISIHDNAAIEGLLIVRKGLTLATDLRSAVNMVGAFAGKAIVMEPGALDVEIRRLGIFGFNKAIDMPTVNERITIEDVIGDNTNGITINNSHDITRVNRAHFWPFLTANFPWSANTQVSVTGATNSSGQIQLTTGAAHGLVTGDVVVVHDVAGVPNANGRWAVFATSSTTVLLSGSTFAGAFTSSPDAKVGIDILRRTGTGIEVLNSETTTISNSFAYDYSYGFHIGTGAGWTQLLGNSVDGQYLLKDPSTMGVLVDGTAYGTTIIGGSYQAHGVAMALNATGTTGTIVANTTINPGASPNPNSVQVLQGRAIFSGNQTNTSVPGQIYIADGAASVILMGNDLPSWTVSASTAAQAVIFGGGNTFAPGTPPIGNLVANNVMAGQFVNSVAPAGFAAAGTSGATASPVFQQRVYVATAGAGTGISINGHSVGADVIVFNGSANAINVYVAQGAGTWNGAASISIAAGTVLRGTCVSANGFASW